MPFRPFRLPLLWVLGAGLFYSLPACSASQLGGFPGEGGFSPIPVQKVPQRTRPEIETIADLPHDLETPPPPDIWERMRAGFQLDIQQSNPRIDAEMKWLKRHPDYINRVAERARPFMLYLIEQIEARGMPLELALLPVVESAFDPFAYSHGSAAGMWQFVPGTAKRFKLKRSWWYEGRRDVLASTQAALEYLTILHRYFDGDWLHALAAYNAGEGNVRKAIRKNQKRNKDLQYWSLDLPRETQGYVPRLMALARIIADPLRYGYDLPEFPASPQIGVVQLEGQIDLSQAARLAGLDINDIYRLNPGFNRWATDPEGPHRLILPLAKIPVFQKAYADLPESERVKWARHTIESGDSLIRIARKYHTSPDLIRRINGLKSDLVRVGDKLLVPVARASLDRYALSADQRLKKKQSQGQRRHDERFEHRVKRGDTLWDLARAHNVSTRKLARWNGMAPGDTLREGQKLVIWKDPRQTATGKSTPGGRSVIRKVGYKIRSGDSLSRIASRFNVSVSDLIRWNSVGRNSVLRPGQHLRIFVDVTAMN